MLSILNRISWLICILIAISISRYDKNLILVWIMLWMLTKFALLSEDFIKEIILDYNKRLEEKIKDRILNELDFKAENKTVEKRIIKNIPDINTETVNLNESKIEENLEFEKQVNTQIELNKLENEGKISENNYKTTVVVKENTEEEIKEETPSRISTFFSEFFAENLMAKVWWILLSLWVIFLMSLVYREIWPVAKIVLGFILWFGIYFIWVYLSNKWLEDESMTLIWVWIIINYIVILSWRFLIWDDWILSSSATFVFLILNTLFSIFTSFIYKSRNLLFFSVIAAYILPLITGSHWSKFSYIIVTWYSVIISIWALAISRYYKESDSKLFLQLLYISLIWANALFLISPFIDSIWFATKLIWFNIINLLVLIWIYKSNFKEHIPYILWLSYIWLILLLINGSFFSSSIVLISYLIWIIILLFSGVFFIIAWITSSILWFLFLPLIIIFALLFSSNLIFAFFIIPLFLIIYLIVFVLISWVTAISTWFKYLFFAILAGFLSISNIHFSINSIILDNYSYFSVTLTAFIFIIASYYLATKKDLNYLYSIWTIAGIFILSPIIKTSWEFMQISIFSVALFSILNYLTPLFSKKLIQNNFHNIIIWIIAGIIFSSIFLYKLWSLYFPWTSLWIAYCILAIIYFIWWFILFNKLNLSLENDDNLESNWSVNLFYWYLGISISLFSISIAIIFSSAPFIVSMAYLFEASILLYFASKLNNIKINIAWIIVLLIWVFKLLSIILTIKTNFVISDFVSLSFISISLFLSILFVKKLDAEVNIFTRILHIIWIILVYITSIKILYNIIPEYWLWNMLISTWIFMFILWVAYNLLKDVFLKNTYIWIFTLLLIFHIISNTLISDYNLNYIFSLIVSIIVIIELMIFRVKSSYYFIFTSFLAYFFIITSFYMYHITQDSFSLTIYWWILAILWIHIWWNKYNFIRISWLYFLIVTLLKIIFYDIWNYVDNWIVRVIAFMFIGSLMIYISYFYRNNNLNIWNDLSFETDSTKWKDLSIEDDSNNEKDENTSSTKIENNNFIINEKINDIDVSDIESIKFNLNNDEAFAIKSKNLFKITKLVLNNYKKTKFVAWELTEIYDYIIINYKSELNSKDYEKLISLIKKFVDKWWSVEIIK